MSLRFPSLIPVALTLVLLWPALTQAQDDPEAGETGSSTGATAEPEEKTPNTWGVAGSGSASAEWDAESASDKKNAQDAGESDHESVVGSVGIGLLGLAEVPVGTSPGAANTVLTAPVLGTRYWLGERFGIEAGIGFTFRRGNVEDSTGNKGDLKSRAFVLHAGTPIALAWGAHYNFLLIPYAGLGFSKATDGRGNATTSDDVFGDGLLFEAGLRAGVEVQLGAVGLPGFALQLSGGVRLRVEKRSANIPILDDDANTPTSYDLDSTDVVFATSQGSTLGSSIAGAIAAIYYF